MTLDRTALIPFLSIIAFGTGYLAAPNTKRAPNLSFLRLIH